MGWELFEGVFGAGEVGVRLPCEAGASEYILRLEMVPSLVDGRTTLETFCAPNVGPGEKDEEEC